MIKTVVKSSIKDAKLLSSGKVREVYDLGRELILVTTDRLSAFDVVMPDPIPCKGVVLNQISLFWFDYINSLNIVGNHIITSDVSKFPKPFCDYKEELNLRSIMVKKAERIDIECIVRGYVEGSGLKEYNETGSIAGIKLSQGLKRADKLDEPIFTPSTKAEVGDHDVNISFEKMKSLVGSELSDRLKSISIKVYEAARDYALAKGIIIADTKFEFGLYNGEIILIDEILTPDSSRFWTLESYEPGKAQESFDKQYVRDYLESLKWNKKFPGPKLPDDVIEKTKNKYIEAYEKITGKKFKFYL